MGLITREEYEALQKKAQQLARQAILNGAIPAITSKTKCEACGKPAKVYDHRDYDKPLEVLAVCVSCNNTLPPALPKHIKINQAWGIPNTEGEKEGSNFNGICHAPINENQIDQHLDYCREWVWDKDVDIVNQEFRKMQKEKKYKSSKIKVIRGVRNPMKFIRLKRIFKGWKIIGEMK